MRVLITGATGFVGSHITRALVGQGHEVIAYDYLPTMSRITDIKDKIKLVRGDICDLEVLANTMKEHRISHVVHLAYFLPEYTIAQNPTKAIRINLEGTNNVFEAARITGAERVVYATSDTVCPMGGEEDSPVRPVSLYGTMKYFNEVMGRHFAGKLGMDTIGVRFGINYGPGGRLLAGELARRYGSAEVLHFIERLILTKKAATLIPPWTEFNWQYVKDNARMVSLALQGSKTGRKIFDVPGERYTLGDVSKLIARMIPGAEPHFEGCEEMPRNVYCVQFNTTIDPLIIKEGIGYTPAYTLEQGLKDYIKECQANPHLYLGE
jgi:nucleoside-diphosphate-sugar epimerase